MVKKCKWEEKYELSYDEWEPISPTAEGYVFRLELLVYGKDIHIALSDKKDIDIEKDPAYEIGNYQKEKKHPFRYDPNDYNF